MPRIVASFLGLEFFFYLLTWKPLLLLVCSFFFWLSRNSLLFFYVSNCSSHIIPHTFVTPSTIKFILSNTFFLEITCLFPFKSHRLIFALCLLSSFLLHYLIWKSRTISLYWVVRHSPNVTLQFLHDKQSFWIVRKVSL